MNKSASNKIFHYMSIVHHCGIELGNSFFNWHFKGC